MRPPHWDEGVQHGSIARPDTAAMLIELAGKRPWVAEQVFIAPNATLVGDVRIEEGVSIWFGAVLRADNGPIVVGVGSNIQDNAVLHVPRDRPTVLGKNVTIGHLATLEGCTIGSGAVIGMGSVVLNRAEVGENAVIAAGSVVMEGASVPAGCLMAGVPARVKKELSEEVLQRMRDGCSRYHQLRDLYLKHRIDQSRSRQ